MKVEIKVKMKDGTILKYNNQAAAIKNARVSAGLSQAAVAEAIGTNVETYQQYEYGTRTPKDATFEKIANALGVAVEILLCVGGEVPIDDDFVKATK
jgi:transcriptional regulator with XRE-family HTH domain